MFIRFRLFCRISTSSDESSTFASSNSVGKLDDDVNEVNHVKVNESPINIEDDEVEENPFVTKKRKKTPKV